MLGGAELVALRVAERSTRLGRTGVDGYQIGYQPRQPTSDETSAVGEIQSSSSKLLNLHASLEHPPFIDSLFP